MVEVVGGVHDLRKTKGGKATLDGTIAKLASDDPMVIMNAKGFIHYHTYGGLTPFFRGLAEGKLLGTRIPPDMLVDGDEHRIWLPPRAYDPDSLKKMEWVEVPPRGILYTHTGILYPGAGFRLSVPCHLISVQIKGVCTRMMSYLSEGEPEIGMEMEAVFNTKAPTNTILDLSWRPVC
ncbi:MAG: OB-fold domain-containing protein [Rhodospirillales bacterium]|nr:OB-fold domain-containing protein [Rhodospirillales bacterium]